MYAVIQTGGKQYKVKKGDTLQVELLPLEMGATTEFKEILLVGGGDSVQIGTPLVSAASVNAEVVAIEKGPKVIVYHKKRRKQSDKKTGHRQPYTRLLITGISGGGQKDTLSAEEKKQVLSNTGFAKADAWEYNEETFDEAAEAQPAKKAAAPKAKKAPAKKAAPKKAAAKKK